MKEDLLDHQAGLPNPAYNPWRKLALAIEGIPFLIAIAGILFSPLLLTVGCCTLAIIYVAGSWYLFKAEKFNGLDIIIAEFFGLGLSVIVLGLLFQFQNWEGYDLMMTINVTTLFLLVPIVILVYILRIRKKYEFTFSKKLVLRIAVAALLTFSLYENWSMFTS